jgi:hypothetical protein
VPDVTAGGGRGEAAGARRAGREPPGQYAVRCALHGARISTVTCRRRAMNASSRGAVHGLGAQSSPLLSANVTVRIPAAGLCWWKPAGQQQLVPARLGADASKAMRTTLSSVLCPLLTTARHPLSAALNEPLVWLPHCARHPDPSSLVHLSAATTPPDTRMSCLPVVSSCRSSSTLCHPPRQLCHGDRQPQTPARSRVCPRTRLAACR